MGNRVVSKRLMEIGERIRERRQTLRWSQEKLAEMADTGQKVQRSASAFRRSMVSSR